MSTPFREPEKFEALEIGGLYIPLNEAIIKPSLRRSIALAPASYSECSCECTTYAYTKTEQSWWNLWGFVYNDEVSSPVKTDSESYGVISREECEMNEGATQRVISEVAGLSVLEIEVVICRFGGVIEGVPASDEDCKPCSCSQ